MNDDEQKICTCGHVEDEHGHDEQYPGSTTCAIDGCDCISFEDADPNVTL